MRKLYCFDLDGTLTTRDTMLSFLSYYNPRRFRYQFVRHLPLFLWMKFRPAETERVKRSLVKSVLKNERKEVLEERAQSFFDEVGKGLIRPAALNFIRDLDEESHGVLVSASIDLWVKPFAYFLGLDAICTKALYVNHRFAGDFVTANCKGDEKVKRILEEIDVAKYDKIIAFGDTAGDAAMLKWADESYFRYFH
ncbi:MAG: HAD-IB family hydrolase [Chryseobacterium sp.]|nr:MAG: HAD-IB family hydrolase [Chryseobacterium sp.]